MVSSFLAFLAQLEATFSTGNPNGLVALFLLAVITDIGVPVPFVLDTILILAAYNVLSTHSNNWTPVLMIVLMLFLGRLVGSAILYSLARFLGKPFILWIKRHVPSTGNRLESFKLRLNRGAPLVITTGRLTPGLLQLTSVASGTVRLRYLDFALGVVLASIIYDGILILLALIASHGPKSDDIDFTIWVLVSLVAVVCILWPLIFIVLRRSGKKVRLSPSPLSRPRP